MKLLHTTKSKATNEIPIDVSLALSPSAFVTKTVKAKGVISHLGLVWRLPALAVEGTKGRHDGHTFELLVEPEWLDKLEAAIQVARSRFAVAEVPLGRRAEEPEVPDEEETIEEEEE